MSNSAQPRPLEFRTPVILLRDIPGSNWNEVGVMVPQSMQAGTQVVIGDSKPRIRKTTPTAISTQAIFDYVYSLYLHDGATYMTNVEVGDEVHTSEKIPHWKLSPTLDGPVSEFYYESSQVLYLLESHEFLTKNGVYKRTMPGGSMIVVTSGLRKTANIALPKGPSNTLYCYQNAVYSQGYRAWTSDHYYGEHGLFTTSITDN